MSSASTCSICLEECNPRGGKPLIINGCCGKTLHKECLDGVLAQGGTTCPDCRATLPDITSRQPPRQRSRLSLGGNIFNMFNGILGNERNNDTSFATGIAGDGYEDSLLPPVEIAPALDTESQVEEITVAVTNTPERKKISTSEHPQFYATVDLEYNNSSTRKTPLDVVCILDISGSMGGSKIESLKKAVEFVISTLGDHDRLSLVEFSNAARRVHGLARMTEDNKIQATRLLHELSAGGGTNIHAGMTAGWDVLNSRREVNGGTCVFLLTDGQDNSNKRGCISLASKMKEKGFSLMVFGFGSDHDSRLMGDIANAGEGDFTYVDTPDTIIDAFGGAIGSQQGTSIKDVKVVLNIENGVKINSVNAGIYKSVVSINNTHSTTTFRQLYPGEKRTVLLQLAIPAVSRGGILGMGSKTEIAEQIIFTSAVTYKDETNRVNKEPVVCTVSRLNEGFDDASIRDLTVDSHVNRCISAKATLDAMRIADSGDFEGAKSLIGDVLSQVRASSSFAAGNSLVMSCVEDLQEALTAVSNRSEYSRGGRAEMSEAYGKSSAQRSCYTKRGKSSWYQSESSMAFQTSALRSKSKK